MDELLTPNEVARILKVPVGTLANWRSFNPFKGPPWIKLNRNPGKKERFAPVRYLKTDVESWISQQKTDALQSEAGDQS